MKKNYPVIPGFPRPQPKIPVKRIVIPDECGPTAPQSPYGQNPKTPVTRRGGPGQGRGSRKSGC
jgi:hypothetical protein